MASSTFRVINRRALREVVMPTTQVVAYQLMGLAVAATPSDTGTLRSSWRVTPGRAPGVFIVENSVPYGKYVEFGTVDTPAVHPLGRAAATIRGRYATR